MTRTFKKKSLICIFLGVCIGIFCKLFIIDIVRIKGTSMEPTLHNGSLIVVSKLSYGIVAPFGDKIILSWAKPKAGDIIIYLYNNMLVIKRCVAVEDNSLEYSSNQGYNLIAKENVYSLSEEQYHRLKNTFSVPKGTLLAIGDNAESSIDSRDYGFIPMKNVIGKALNK